MFDLRGGHLLVPSSPMVLGCSFDFEQRSEVSAPCDLQGRVPAKVEAKFQSNGVVLPSASFLPYLGF